MVKRALYRGKSIAETMSLEIARNAQRYTNTQFWLQYKSTRKGRVGGKPGKTAWQELLESLQWIKGIGNVFN